MTYNEAQLLLQAVAGVLALILFLQLLIRKSWTSSSLPLPPGPKGFPLVGNLLSLNSELTTCFTQLAQEYGPIFTLKLGRKIGVVISSPELAREVLQHRDATFAYRDMPVVAKETSYEGSNISWSPYGPVWRMLKGLASREMLSNKSLDSVHDLRRREARLMVKYLYSRAGSPVNVGEQSFITILNVITSMLWGGRQSGGDAGLGLEFREVIVQILGLLGTFNVSDFYPELARFDVQGLHKRMKVLTSRFDKIFDDILDQRMKNMDDGRRDFLHVLLKLKDEQSGKEVFTMTHLKALLMDILTAGTDSTANTIEFALAEMMDKPHILEKVRQEVDQTVSDDHKHSMLEETAIQNLPYMRALMKETLRLHPALPLLAPHCPNSTCNVAGYEIPKGARVIINAWAIHRDPMTWEDPLEFRPERFLDGKFDHGGDEYFKYFPFGSGRRSCVGTAMAERMFMYLVATLVHCFDWKLAPGVKMDLSEKYGLVLRKKIPLIAIPTPRLSSPSLYDQ